MRRIKQSKTQVRIQNFKRFYLICLYFFEFELFLNGIQSNVELLLKIVQRLFGIAKWLG